LPAFLAAQPKNGPVNLDFKNAVVGQLPDGWSAPLASKGFPAAATDQCSKPDTLCGVVRSEQVTSPGPFGNMMQYFDAVPYRNKQVRFRAAVRVASPDKARAQLWLRVDRSKQRMGFFDNMGDRPIVSSDWRTYEINGEVSDDATGIAMGLMLIGGQGAAYIDQVSFEVTGEVTPPSITERSRPLSGRGLENPAAYARLYGYIRHFHPGEEAFLADWEAIAVAGVPAVEGARNAEDLARKLEDYFRAVAPTVRVFPASAPAPVTDLGAGTKMISWRHYGFGTGKTQSIYHSERITADAPDGKLPAPFLADLGGGVKASLPLALFADAKGVSVPKSTPTIRFTANDRATRIGDVVIAWNILQHFYPYFDAIRTDWPKALETALESAAADRDEDAFLLTLRKMIAALKDGHGHVSFGSPGAPAPLAWDWIEGRLVITQVPDSQGQPIERGDAVLSINGKPVEQAIAQAEALVSGATPQWIRSRALHEIGVGSANEPLVLEIESFREPGHRQTVTLKRGASAAIETRPAKIAELRPGIYYVDLTRISDSDFAGAVPKLAKATGIVFDMRGYPRVGPRWMTHLSDNVEDSAQWHVPIITQPDHQNMQFDHRPGWNMPPEKPYFAAKRVVLTDGSAISYAESTMGIVEAYKLATIVGSATAGTNGNINPFTLPGGYTITWTGMKVLKHDGSRHHGVGIQPTIPVARTRAGVAAGRDEVLERGLGVLQ
jgi:C-terminal processing protease CtpA/Prc